MGCGLFVASVRWLLPEEPPCLKFLLTLRRGVFCQWLAPTPLEDSLPLPRVAFRVPGASGLYRAPVAAVAEVAEAAAA